MYWHHSECEQVGREPHFGARGQVTPDIFGEICFERVLDCVLYIDTLSFVEGAFQNIKGREIEEWAMDELVTSHLTRDLDATVSNVAE